MKHLIGLLLLVLLSYWSIRPLFFPGFFPMHDDTQPTRVQQMTRSLAEGQFPVRWVADLGYGFGYPIFNFYAPLPYYTGALGMFAGMDALTATKVVMSIGMITAGVCMFLLASRIAGPAAGLIGGILYLYAPYHAVNLYVRGAIGELWAYGFLPLVILGIYEVMNGNKRHGVILGSVGLVTVLLSHNILGMITLMFFVAGIAAYTILYRKKETGIYLVALFLLGAGLSAFFTVPAFLEKGYTRVEELTGGGSDFREHFVYPDQLWDWPWGYAGSAPGRADGMSFKIGKLHLILAAISSLFLFLFYKRRKVSGELSSFAEASADKWVVSCALWVFFLISTFLMLPVSQFLWDTIPGFAYIQYPWRFLNPVLLCLSLLASLTVSLVPGKLKWFVAVGIIVLTIHTNSKYFTPKYQDTRSATDYTDQSKIRFDISKISDEYMPPDFPPPQSPGAVSSDMLLSDDRLIFSDTLINTSRRKVYSIVMREDGAVSTPVAYFPGWRVLLDGVFSQTTQKDGQIYASVLKGTHTLSLDFYQTPVELLGNTISILSLFLLGYVSLSGRMLQTWEKNRPLRS